MGPQASSTNDGAPAFHAEPARKVLERLESDPGAGLSAEEARRRLDEHGPNELPKEKRAGFALIFLRQFTDPLIYILLIATLVSLAIGNFANAIFIGLVLLLNAAIGTFQEFRAESSAKALQEVVRIRPRVLRGGKTETLEGADLVPGDIVRLESGSAVAADMRLIESSDLRADESLLTGESTPVDKEAEAELDEDTTLADRATMLHAGSAVIGGRAKGVVVRTGAATQIGSIARTLTESESGDPPLVLKLRRLTRWIAILTLCAIAVLAGVQFARGEELGHIFALAVALAVAAIPAGLPAAVTVALSVASTRMAERNVIVRRLPAVEGLGSCTVIASDKTGTLTANQLTVQRVWLGQDRQIEVGGQGLSLSGEITVNGGELDEETRDSLARFATAAALANESELTVENGEITKAEGDSTDLAFLVLAEKLDLDRARLTEEHIERERIPFDPSARFGAVFMERQGRLVAYVKGAPERIVEMCTGGDRDAIEKLQKEWAGEGFRLLAVAAGEVKSADPEALSGLRLLGLAAMIDPLRDEVPEAIERCHSAGVGVRMITGDHPDTALAIGRGLGLTEREDQVLSGSELASDSGEAAERIEKARVFARVEPLQKTEIVDGLTNTGEFVAVTGDGVNDAPALRRANIGIAMGESGTDVARSTADLILTDDNFASIVAGIEQGRVAYDNVRKVVWLLLATGAAEVLLFFLALGFGMPIPLTAVQLLWLNLVTNGIQDVAMAFERAEPGVLERPPRSPGEPILDRRMVEEVLLSGAFMGLAAFGVYFYLSRAIGLDVVEARNLTLLLMVLFENVHALSCRSERRSLFRIPVGNNPLLILGIAAAQGVHIAAMYIPGLNDVLQVQPVELRTWLILLGIASTLLVFDEAAKSLKSRRNAPGSP